MNTSESLNAHFNAIINEPELRSAFVEDTFPIFSMLVAIAPEQWEQLIAAIEQTRTNLHNMLEATSAPAFLRKAVADAERNDQTIPLLNEIIRAQRAGFFTSLGTQ